MNRLLILLILTAFCSLVVPGDALAQQPDQPQKSFFVDSLNRFYTQTSLPLYIRIASSPDGANAVTIPQSNSATEVNPITPMYLDGDGKHHIKHYDEIDKKEAVFVVYADGKAPLSAAAFLNSPSYSTTNKIYYGKKLTVDLKTTDDMTGVKSFQYSINGQPYSPYTKPLLFDREGDQVLKFYAYDQVGNVEEPVEKHFTIDTTSPVTYYHVTGLALEKKIVSPASVIYLEPTDNIAGVAGTWYSFNNQPARSYTDKDIPFQQLPEGEHTLWFYSIDKVKNRETRRRFDFFYDKTAPIVATDILGDRFIVNEQVYFSGRTKLKITAVDNKVGIKQVMYSVDNDEFGQYSEPFYLPARQGIHTIRYYAIDSLDNSTGDIKKMQYQEFRHTVSKVFVDLTGPTLYHHYDGPNFTSRDTVFINHTTLIRLSQTDGESGTQRMSYAIGKNPLEIDYKSPFTMTQPGFQSIQVIGYDNVNNRNQKTISFVVDPEPPVIDFRFSVKPIGRNGNLDVYPPFTRIYLAPYDNLSGVESILVSINGLPATPYTGAIGPLAKGKLHKVEIKATDKLGNASSKMLEFMINDK